MENTQIRLWTYAFVYAAEILNRIASTHVAARSVTPFELVYGYSPDISEFVSYEWYEVIWYQLPTEFQSQKLGRWLDVTNNIGSGHVYQVITQTGQVISTSSISHLTDKEMKEDRIKRAIKELDDSIESKIGNYRNTIIPGNKINNDTTYLDFMKDDDLDLDELIEFQERLKDNSIFSIPESDETKYNNLLGKELQDKYVGVRVLLLRGNSYNEAVIKKRKRTADGNYLLGKEDTNPILDTRIYEVEFADGGIGEYGTNMIAESLYSSCNEEGNHYSLLQGIVSHRTTADALKISEGFCEINGVRRRKITTTGWELQIQWVDGTCSWLPLKDIKESNPLQVAEYEVSRNLD